MNKKKNKAVNKAEKVSKKSESSVQAQGQALENKIEAKKEADRIKREKLHAEKQERLAEKERIKAERRVELARIEAERKANLEKSKAQKIKEKNRRKAQIKKLKEQRKAEKLKRKEYLKNETKQEKERRIKAEKQEKLRIKREKQANKDELKRQRQEQKHQRKQDRQNKGYGGWLAAVISLGISVLVLSSVLTMTLVVPTAVDTEVGNVYRKSFYDTVSHVDNIDVDLAKIMATKDSGSMQKYLVDVAVNSELAENDLGELPLRDEAKYYTVKLINQLGDYAKYLNNKLVDGEKLTKEDWENLTTLYTANKKLQTSLKELMDKMGDNYDFNKLLEENKNDVMIKGLTEIQNLSVELPELIYDGPFSDAKKKDKIKGVTGEEISRAQAKEIFTEIFADYKFSEITESGETIGDFETYNFTAMTEGDAELYAEITKKGGNLILFDMISFCQEESFDKDECVRIGYEFLDKIGLKDMTPVWASQAYGVVTINYVYENNDVIYYPDMVKVTVCQESGKVTGYEASDYYTNHTNRNLTSPTLSSSEASSKVSDNVGIITARLCLIPVGEKEVLAYEFMGNIEEETYFVYINATNGRQEELFMVVNSADGQLLI